MNLAHGTRSRYIHHGCRCAACTEANRDKVARQRIQRRSELVEIDGVMVHPRAVHGTVGGYRNWSCRCADCTTVHSRACADYKQRRKESSNG